MGRASAFRSLGLDDGHELSPSLRADFEPRFNADLSHVRIHDDLRARQLTARFGANAFAIGRDIVLGTPVKSAERGLIAHELAHVTSRDNPETLYRDPVKPVAVGLGVPVSPDAVSGIHDWSQVYAAPSRASDFNTFYVGSIVMKQISTFDSNNTPHVHVYYAYSKSDDDDKWAVGPDSVMEFVATHGGSIVGKTTNTDTPATHTVCDPAPEIESRHLPEALDAYQGDAPSYGPQLSYVAGALPRYDTTGQSFTVNDYYVMKPYLRRLADKSYAVLYYVAENMYSEFRPEYIVPPHCLQLFKDKAAMFGNIATLSFPIEPGAMPSAYQQHSARFVVGTFAGDVSRAKEGTSAWFSAAKDPGWLMQVGMGYASAVQPEPPLNENWHENAPVFRGGKSFAIESTNATSTTSTNVPAAGGGGTALAVADPVPINIPVTTPKTTPVPKTNPLQGLPTNANVKPVTPRVTPMSTGQKIGSQLAAQTLSKTQQTRSKSKIPITLHLPIAKAVHLNRYRALAQARQLVHSKAYERGSPAQRTKWKTMMRPLTPGGKAKGFMEKRMYDRGVALMRTYGYASGESDIDDKVLVPHWSRAQKPPIDTEVDHVVELQLLGARRPEWANKYGNFEILNQPANGSSGSKLDGNIAAERKLQADYYNDQSWMRRDLVFDRVEADGGGQSVTVRWLDHEVSDGEHIKALEELVNTKKSPY
ncbi:MAG: DUF4157 domain-containing protein [Kofleriaceae bacterium]